MNMQNLQYYLQFTNTIECQQMATSCCELNGFREILLVFCTKITVFTERL